MPTAEIRIAARLQPVAVVFSEKLSSILSETFKHLTLPVAEKGVHYLVSQPDETVNRVNG